MENPLTIRASQPSYILGRSATKEFVVRIDESTPAEFNFSITNNGTDSICLNFQIGQVTLEPGVTHFMSARNGLITNGECHSSRERELKLEADAAKSFIARMIDGSTKVLQSVITNNYILVQHSGAPAYVQLIRLFPSGKTLFVENALSVGDEKFIMGARNDHLYILADSVLTEYSVGFDKKKNADAITEEVGRSLDMKDWLVTVNKTGQAKYMILSDQYLFLSTTIGTFKLGIENFQDKKQARFMKDDTDIVPRNGGYLAWNATTVTGKVGLHVESVPSDPAKPQFVAPEDAVEFPLWVAVAKKNHNSDVERVYVTYKNNTDKLATAIYQLNHHDANKYDFEQVVENKTLFVTPDGRPAVEDSANPKSLFNTNENGTITFTYAPVVGKAFRIFY